MGSRSTSHLNGQFLRHARAGARWRVWVLCLALSACAAQPPAPPVEPDRWVLDPGYYLQAVQGHLRLLGAGRPIADWLRDPATSPALRARLQLVQRLRVFAALELGLPDNASYTRYADLRRAAAVWNVVAAPDDTLRLRSWCFLGAGCLPYRGFFDEDEARRYARSLPVGLDVAVYPVPAYSTLGWSNWLGGDPVLNTFLAYPEGELARILFHELTHQAAYVPGDAEFNESLATVVEQAGVSRWLAAHGNAQARADYAAFDARRQDFLALTRQTRQALEKLYADAAPLSRQRLLARKHAILTGFRARHAELKAGWDGYTGYDAWVAQANNASFAVQSTYQRHVAALQARLHAAGGSVPDLLAQARELSRLSATDRERALTSSANITDTKIRP